MNVVDAIFLIGIWGIVIGAGINGFLTMSKNDRNDVKRSWKQSLIIIVEASRFIGFALFFSGVILSIPFLKHTGIFIVIFSWFLAAINTWETSKKRSILIHFIVVLVTITYILISF